MAQAEYAIDIAARMTGAEATTSELDALTADLMGAGKGAEFFQAAIQRVAGDLDASKAATIAANEALAAGQSEYRLLEKAALQAAKAAEKAALKNGGVIPDDLKTKLDATNGQVEAYARTLKGLETNVTDATAKEKKLGETLSNVKKLSGHVDKSFTGQAESLSKLQSGLSAIGGPLGRLGSPLVAGVKGFEEMSGSMGTANATMLVMAAGAALVVAAVVAIAVAVVAGTIAIASWAVGLADANRNAALASEAFNTMNPDLAALSGAFADVSAATGATTPELQALAKQLKDAKVAAADMPAALKAAALAEAALGKGGASGFIDDIKAGKSAVSDLAAETQAKLGGIVARQMLGLEAQSARLKSNMGALFGGLEITPVLEGMQTLVGLFDKSTAAGQAMKLLFEKVFQPLIDQAQNAAYVVEAFALGFLIGLMKLYIAIKPTIKAIGELFGFEDTSLTDVLTSAKNAGEIFAKVFVFAAVVIGGLTVAIGLVIGAVMAWNLAVMAAVGVIVVFAAKAIAGIVSFFTELPKHISDAFNAIAAFFTGLPAQLAAIDWQKVGADAVIAIAAGVTSAIGAVIAGAQALAAGVVSAVTGIPAAFMAVVNGVIALVGDVAKWATIGAQIALGIAQGIAGAAGAVLGAIGGVVSGAIGQAKKMLGIASPSKVFAGIGAFTGEGFVGGVEDQTDAAQTALTDMVTPPVTAMQAVDAIQTSGGAAPTPSVPTPNAAPAAASAGKAFDLSGATFNFYGVKDAEQATESFGEMLTRLIEGDVAQLGGEMAPA